jgi:prolyl-tRNA synthetase
MEHSQKENISNQFLEFAKKAELFNYGPFKGSIVIRPYAYAIWEKFQAYLDAEIKKMNCDNIYFPCLIPESLLSREKEHVENFSPELAVVTHGGGEELAEKLAVRPTSETLMYHYFSGWISSWRDLPFKVNQWSNVIRWELRPFPFLRTSEFLWQEGHTVHNSYEGARDQVLESLKMYERFFHEVLAMPVVVGHKTEKEKFAGALYSASCESLMLDGNALQVSTAHNLSQNFSKVFEVIFQDKEGKKEYGWQTSWGLSTRALGGMFLTHMDDKGLIIPPRVAPIQVQIIPIGMEKTEKVLDTAKQIKEHLRKEEIRTKLDISDQTPGWKFNNAELKGIPIRIEIGPKDLEKEKVVVVRRDTGEKEDVFIKDLNKKIPELLEKIQSNLHERAQKFKEENSYQISDYEKFKEIMSDKRGFVYSDWCGDQKCEEAIKAETKATTRCIPLEKQPSLNTGKCIYCGKEANYRPVWARNY